MSHPARSLSFLLKSRQDDSAEIYQEPVDSEHGGFIFPVTYPLNFRETSSINITWTTDYEAVNLYYYQSGKVANSSQITTNLALQWFQWQVRADEIDFTLPYVFRIVNARGTEEEQTQEGFWSTSFYILQDNTSGSTRSSTSSSSSSSTSSTTSTPPFSTTSSPTSSFTSSTQTSTPSNTPSVDSGHNGGLSSGAVAGIAVGATLGAVALAAAAFWYGRRKAASGTQPVAQAGFPKPPDPRDIRAPAVPAYYPPSELQGVTTYHEMTHN